MQTLVGVIKMPQMSWLQGLYEDWADLPDG